MKHIFSSLPVADMAKRYTINYFDIGARGGFQSDLHPIAFVVDVVGFEPDPVEFEQLQLQSSEPWRSVTFLPWAISHETGPKTLYIPVDPQSASLMKHNLEIGKKFQKQQFFDLDRTLDIQTLCLKEAVEKTGFQSVDYLKIDIEGLELDIFRSSPDIMKDVLAIKTEVSFLQFRNGQPLASDVDVFLRQGGFELMDAIDVAHWRRHGHIVHPYYSAEKPPYSKGQIMQADCLYFRDPDQLDGDIPKLLKLSLIAMSFGYFDHALMILERADTTDFLDTEFGLSPIEIVAPASKIYGRKAFRGAFFRQVRNLIPFVRYSKNLLR